MELITYFDHDHFIHSMSEGLTYDEGSILLQIFSDCVYETPDYLYYS